MKLKVKFYTAKREFQEETGAIEFEIDKIEFFNNIPINLTYPEIQPYLYVSVK